MYMIVLPSSTHNRDFRRLRMEFTYVIKYINRYVQISQSLYRGVDVSETFKIKKWKK